LNKSILTALRVFGGKMKNYIERAGVLALNTANFLIFESIVIAQNQ